MKPEEIFKYSQLIENADWILFPSYRLVNLMAYVFKKPIFPNLSTYYLGFDKIEMTRAFLIRFPRHTPHTIICSNEDHNIEMILDTMPLPFVAKEIRNSQGKGTCLIQNRKDLKRFADQNDMLYIQEKLDIDRDLRIVWAGDRIVTAYWRIAPYGGFLNNLSAGGSIHFNDIPEEALLLIQSVCQTLNINYAGFDIAISEGHCYLLEYNLFFGTQALNEKKIPLNTIIYQYLLNQIIKNIPPQNPIIPRAA